MSKLRILQAFASWATGIWLAIALALDISFVYIKYPNIHLEVVNIPYVFMLHLPFLALLSFVLIWNIDWETVNKSIYNIIRPSVALTSYFVAVTFNQTNFFGTPDWLPSALNWSLLWIVPFLLFLDLVLGTIIFFKAKKESD